MYEPTRTHTSHKNPKQPPRYLWPAAKPVGESVRVCACVCVCMCACVCVCPGLTNLGCHHTCPAGIIRHILCPLQTHTPHNKTNTHRDTHTHTHTHRLPTPIHHPKPSVQLAKWPHCPFVPSWYSFTSASSHLRLSSICRRWNTNLETCLLTMCRRKSRHTNLQNTHTLD